MLLALRGIKEDLAAYLAEAAPGIATEEVIAHIASADVRALFERARAAPIAAAQVAKARAALRERIVPAYRELFRAAGIAAIAFPTTPMAAPPIRAGGDSPDDLIEIAGTPVNAALASIRNTLVTAALGAPGLSLPAGLTSQGLPVGLEVDALPGADDGLLALGLTLESALA
jgi:mandelamide amidase